MLDQSVDAPGVVADERVVAQDGEDSSYQRHQVLIADEDLALLRLLGAVLAPDFDVTVAKDGQEAVDLAKRCCPDVVLLDLGMPVLDGFAACRKIHAAAPGLPIVILSGRTDEPALREAFEAGASDYLTKPFTASVLRSRLRANLLRAS